MTITSYNSTADNNTTINGISVAGTAAVSNMDDGLRNIMADISNWTDADTVVSATTTNLGSVEGMYVTVSGTATITGFGTIKSGLVKFVRFSAAGTITYNATSLILPGAANITRAAGDTAVFVSEGSGNWRCVAYQRAASPLTESEVASGSATSLTSGSAKTITSISLSPGVYAVSGNAFIVPDGTVTVFTTAISTSNNALPTAPGKGGYNVTRGSITATFGTPTGTAHLTITSSTTVYLVVSSTFTSNATAYGYIGALRIG